MDSILRSCIGNKQEVIKHSLSVFELLPLQPDNHAVTLEMDPYLGLYHSDQGQFDIVWREGELLGMANVRDRMKIIPVNEREFIGRIQDLPDMRQQFSFDKNGEVQGVKTTFGFTEIVDQKI